MLILLNGILGLAVIRVTVGHRASERQSVSDMSKKIFQLYQNLFSLKYGKYFFQKLFVLEIGEMILQYLSFQELCHKANLQYMVMVFVLITLNVTISPLLMVCRDKFEKKKKRKVRHLFV